MNALSRAAARLRARIHQATASPLAVPATPTAPPPAPIASMPSAPVVASAGTGDTFPLSKADARYIAWVERLRGAKIIGVEHLLPQMAVPCPRDLPALMASGAQRTGMSDKALKARVERLRPWGYGIQLRPGIATEGPVALERMIYRSHLISGAIRRLLGEQLRDTTFIDFACNHGYFTLELAHAGARKATGLDLRAENVAKAEFLKSHFDIPNAEFRQGDIYDLDASQQVDVVLNLGVLYHITDPYKLVQLSYDACRRFAVIDTIMHKEPVSAYIQRVNKDQSMHAEGKFSVELHPTYRAVIDLMHAVGFQQVIEIVPEEIPGRCPHQLYDRHDRRCLIGFKEPFDLMPHGIRPPPLPT